MRRTLSALMLLGLTATVVAQTPQTPAIDAKDVPIRGELRLGRSGTVFTYRQSEREGRVLRLIGSVKFTIGGTVVTADEAIVDGRSGEVRLLGDVRLTIE